MSRKDYRAVAAALKYLKSTSPYPADWDRIVEMLGQVFQHDNPRFDWNRFLKAVNQ